LKIVKGFSHRPGRICLNKIGLPNLQRTRNAIIINTGIKTMAAGIATAKSNARLPKYR
jgi:hypothetical protein